MLKEIAKARAELNAMLVADIPAKTQESTLECLLQMKSNMSEGRENAKTFLRENPEMADRLEKAIRQRTEKVAEEMMAGPEADDDL